jgi:mono/diheme cytochrome c family protein
VKWFKRIMLGLGVLIVVAIVVLYGWSSVIVGKKYSIQERTLELTDDPAVIARGERLAQVFGCFHGCHGADMEGNIMVDELVVGRLAAPNLTTAFDRYSIPELEAIIRQGLRPDGTSVVAMPSDGFSVMTDSDLSAILSFIRTYPRQEHETPARMIGPVARLLLISGEFWVAASRTSPEPWQEDIADDPEKLGEYLARNACAECHGPELEGREGLTPPLTIAKAYSAEDFSELMSTGIGLGGRELGLMTDMVTYRLRHLNEEEVSALYAYLNSR